MRQAITFILILLTSCTFATNQRPDILIYKGDTINIYTYPLEDYLYNDIKYPEDSLKLVKDKYYFGEDHSTNCYRGYFAIWEIQNDSLFLKEVYDGDNLKKINLDEIFPSDLIHKQVVHAFWYSSEIFYCFGSLIHDHSKQHRMIYEYEQGLVVKKGCLENIKHYDNLSDNNSNFKEPSDIVSFVYENLNHNELNFNELLENDNHRMLLICEINPQGGFKNIEIKKGICESFNREVISTLNQIKKKIGYYRRGLPLDNEWLIILNFSNK